VADRLFPQNLENVAIDQALLLELHSQSAAGRWAGGAGDTGEEGDGAAAEYAEAPVSDRIRTVADAVAALGREAELQVSPARDAERYFAFIKKLAGYPRVHALWQEEEREQLRRYEWATLRDLALLAGEIDAQAGAMMSDADAPPGIDSEFDEFEDAATLAGAVPAITGPGQEWGGEASAVAAAAPIGRLAPPRCLEIGNGFGRLSDAILNLFDGQAKVVVVASDPTALAASFAYLSARWPDHRAAICTAPLEPVDLDRADILIVPRWHLGNEALAHNSDVVAALDGLEELSDAELAEHIAFADRAVAAHGLLYLMASRDLVNPREYAYPATWQLRYKRRTPWSESPDHPVEIYGQTDRDCRALNRRGELAYLRHVVRQYRGERLAREQNRARLAAVVTQSRTRHTELAAALLRQRARNAELLDRLELARLDVEDARRAMAEFFDSSGLYQSGAGADRAPWRTLDRALLRLRQRTR
jgi:hypothetical protein